MRLITLEEHYRAPGIRELLPGPGGRFPRELYEIGSERLADMDAAGIDLQVLSHTVPATERFAPDQAVPLARATNDYLAAAIAVHPGRFAAFATPPTPAPGWTGRSSAT
jgi:predicted TIM-barrel fold metal-dependent hydrolase